MCYSFSFIGNPDPLGTLHYMGHSLLNQKCVCKYHKYKSSKKQKQCFTWIQPRGGEHCHMALMKRLLTWLVAAPTVTAAEHLKMGFDLKVEYGMKPRALD